MKKVTYTFNSLNFILGVVGISGVWFTTHSLWAVFWTIIAALHIEFTIHENP